MRAQSLAIASPSAQTSIAAGQAPPAAGAVNAGCQWCERPASVQREIAPAKVNKRTKVTELAALTVSVCDEHAAMVDRAIRERDLKAQISTLNRRLARTPQWGPHVARRAEIAQQLGAARLALAELSS